ncbi:MAG: family 43 glycosylhydrolase [Clostridiales bacterium]|nr:family 43 glycosylhydrolase [Clostridiales bacterium]
MALDIYRKKTWCNPLSMPDVHRGTDSYRMDFTGEPYRSYRSISDPSVLYHDGKWYLYPSYDMAYVSEDFVNWEYVPCTPPDAVDGPRYSPAVVPCGDRFLLTISGERLFIGNTPTGPFEPLGDCIMPNGARFKPCDPGLFRDDDGRIYIYWHGSRTHPVRGVWSSLTLAAELDANDPCRLLCEPVMLNEFDPEHTWECFGEYNQNTSKGWIEGQWMFKHNGRYYLIYSGCGTEFGAYAMGVYYSDKGPLEGFVYQKKNPLTFNRTGLIKGAGHGSVAHGPNNSIWVFYTTTMCYTHCYERRIGMDRLEVDENGELYCPAITDTPQYGATEPEIGDTGLKPLTVYIRARHRASSHSEGRDSLYALDESMQTWWQPAADDKQPWLLVNLEGDFVIEASRIIWYDVGLDYDNGVLPGPFKYKIEACTSLEKEDWTVILNMTENNEDRCIDYRSFKPFKGSAVRLTITGSPEGITPGVISFSVFGKM